MKLFIFIFTVFFMLTVTLQESLAQAATQPEEKSAAKNEQKEAEEFIKKFTHDPENFYPQAAGKTKGISDIEGEDGSSDPANFDSKKWNAVVDRHTNTHPAKTAANKGTVRDAIGGGSKTESER